MQLGWVDKKYVYFWSFFRLSEIQACVYIYIFIDVYNDSVVKVY